MTDVWVTSDTHFYHSNIIKYMPESRNFVDVDDMNESLIERWNSKVKPNDIIYHLGDVGFCNATKLSNILDRLNGQLHLVRGNHDNVFESNSALRSKLTWFGYYKEIKVSGEKVVLMHFPIEEWNRAQHGSIHLHGHTHLPKGQNIAAKGRKMDVGCDSNDCTPYHIEDVVSLLKRREIHSIYHASGR